MTDKRIKDAYNSINISPEAEARIWQELAEENAKHGEKRRRSLWWGVSAALITAAAVFVAAILPGRLEKPAEEPETPLASPVENTLMPPTLMSVLDGAEFYFAAEARYMTIGMSSEAFGISLDHNDSVRIGVYRYCLCDLDADGTDELIMEVSNNGSDDILGYIIVRTEGNRFVGYVSFYRGFHDLKTDGTYSYANSASCSGVGTAQFTDTVMLTDDLAHTEPRYDDKGNILEQGYFIGADRVTDTEYWAFIDTQDAKENVYWLDINDAAYVRMG